MKKLTALILIFAMLCLMGCQKEDSKPGGVPFYYQVAQPAYGEESTVIAAEYRSDVKTDSLMDALVAYLKGPSESELASPFPEGLQILSAQQQGDTVELTVSLELTTLSGLELTIACGCLTMTSLALTDAQQVRIMPIYGLLDGQRGITMDKNTILLYDDSKAEQ